MNGTDAHDAAASHGHLGEPRAAVKHDRHARRVHRARHDPDPVHGRHDDERAAAPHGTHPARPHHAHDAAHGAAHGAAHPRTHEPAYARADGLAHASHGHRHAPAPAAAAAVDAPAASAHGHGTGGSLNRVALSATLHCLTGCAIGEVAGMVIGTALGFGNLETVALAFTLAFFSGYALTMLPLLRAGVQLRSALKLALAADTASIAIMEIVDNAVMLVVPGAMDAPLDSALFWGSLALALAIAAAAAYPVVRWLIARGRGHAVVHAYHGHH